MASRRFEPRPRQSDRAGFREQSLNRVVEAPMTKVPCSRWWHVAAPSLLLAATLMFLVHRFFVPWADPPNLLRMLAAPPLDGGFVWYPILAAPTLAWAYARRSLRLVLTTQTMLLVVGFVHVLWIAGTVPGKLDLRLVLIVLVGQAVAWTNYLCIAAAVAIGLRRAAAPSIQSEPTSTRLE